MKEQIDKLIALAKDYVVFGIEVGLPDTHNHIRGGHQDNPIWRKEGKLINVYFSNKGETWSVHFGDVEICGYASKVSMPMNADSDYLDGVYSDVKEYLHDYLLPDVAKAKLSVMKERHVKIKELERELRTLKGLV